MRMHTIAFLIGGYSISINTHVVLALGGWVASGGGGRGGFG